MIDSKRKGTLHKRRRGLQNKDGIEIQHVSINITFIFGQCQKQMHAQVTVSLDKVDFDGSRNRNLGMNKDFRYALYLDFMKGYINSKLQFVWVTFVCGP